MDTSLLKGDSMKSTALLTGLFLMAGAALALPHPKTPQPPANEIFGAPPHPSQSRSDDRALYYLLGSAGRELEFDVRVNGRSYLDEKLTLPADAAGATFELLAGDKVHRDRLFKLAENWRSQVLVTVKVDGGTVRELSFQELLNSSRDLQRLPIRLGQAAKGTRSFSPEASGAAKPNPLSGLLKDCTSSCQSQFYSCMSSVCAGQEECDYCNQEFYDCNSGCPPPTCTDPKNVSYYNSSPTLTNVQWTGSACLGDSPYATIYFIYDHDYLTYRTDHYTQTTYCDGHTETSYYSTYSTVYCWSSSYSQCYSPDGYTYNICY
jgi:hypothetical protein